MEEYEAYNTVAEINQRRDDDSDRGRPYIDMLGDELVSRGNLDYIRNTIGDIKEIDPITEQEGVLSDANINSVIIKEYDNPYWLSVVYFERLTAWGIVFQGKNREDIIGLTYAYTSGHEMARVNTELLEADEDILDQDNPLIEDEPDSKEESEGDSPEESSTDVAQADTEEPPVEEN